MRWAVLALTLFGVASLAQAQTTDCFRNPMGFSCNTQPSTARGLDQLLAGIAAMKNANLQRQAQAQRQQAQQAAQSAAYTRQQTEQRIIALIQAHDCIGARDVALSVSDLDLASKVVQLCPIPLGLPPQ